VEAANGFLIAVRKGAHRSENGLGLSNPKAK
jgi:hypothetical protein